MKKLNKQKIIKEFQDYVDDNGEFYKKEWDRLMSCNKETIRIWYGSFDNFVKIANRNFKVWDRSNTYNKGKKLNELFNKEKVKKIKNKQEIGRKKSINIRKINKEKNKQKIIKEFQDYVDDNGEFYKKDWDKLMNCNKETIRIWYGSFDNFEKIAGRNFKVWDKPNKNKGKTWKEILGKDKEKQLRERYKIFRGKSWEEKYGLEKTNQMKNSIRLKQSKNLKNKSWEERYGIKKANMLKMLVSKRLKKNKNSKKINREDIIIELQEKVLKYGVFKKCEFDKFMSCCNQTARSNFGSLDELARVANIEFKPTFWEKGFKKKRVGKNEKQILDKIEKENNIILERQFQVQRYYIDGYDKKNNVAYEVDEPYHKTKKSYDLFREEKIKKILGCDFIRVDEKKFLNKIYNKSLNEWGVC